MYKDQEFQQFKQNWRGANRSGKFLMDKYKQNRGGEILIFLFYQKLHQKQQKIFIQNINQLPFQYQKSVKNLIRILQGWERKVEQEGIERQIVKFKEQNQQESFFQKINSKLFNVKSQQSFIEAGKKQKLKKSSLQQTVMIDQDQQEQNSLLLYEKSKKQK